MERTEVEPKKPRTLPAEERRDQLLAAACAVFAEKGYHEAKISDVTARAGVGKGTFYLYFKSKEEVYGALLDDFTRLIFLAFFIPGADEVKTGRDIRGRFERVTRNALGLLRDNRNLARLFLQEGISWEPVFEGRVRSFYQDLSARTAQNLAAWMAKGLLRSADPVVLAHCVLGMVERVAVQLTAGTIKGDFEALVSEVVRFELYGILADPAAAFA